MELQIYDEGLIAIKKALDIEPKNKECSSILNQLKEASNKKKNQWNDKMDGFLVNEKSKYHKISQEDERIKKLKKKIDAEMNTEEEN
mmetsp:Transcript_23372/g.20768  ORF Transcript_23372/g.20768 Transcript_23372/m.20768 type:complete len:87 (+) Transcript_23372:998-1258(+)